MNPAAKKTDKRRSPGSSLVEQMELRRLQDARRAVADVAEEARTEGRAMPKRRVDFKE